jgi:hypothetical protein
MVKGTEMEECRKKRCGCHIKVWIFCDKGQGVHNKHVGLTLFILNIFPVED